MQVQVPWSELEDHFEKTLKKVGGKIQIPGFRKGKVPRDQVVKMYLPQIEADFAEESVNTYYLQALDEKELIPINQAKIQKLDFSYGGDLSFTALFEVEPPVELPKYQKKMKVKKNFYIPDEEDVNIFIKEIRQQFAELKTVESGSEDGHLLLGDMQELDESGLPIIGKKMEDKYIKVGEGLFGGDNLTKLKGLKSGDEAKITISNPDSNQIRNYTITVKNVHEEILPELDKDFMNRIFPDTDNENDFRKKIMESTESNLKKDSEDQLNEAVIDYFIQSTTLEVPLSMVDNYINRMVDDAISRNGEEFDEEKFKNAVMPSTIKNIKWFLIRKQLIKKEDLKIEDSELDSKVQEFANNSEKDRKQEIIRFYKKPRNREDLRESMLTKKLFEFLKGVAKIMEQKVYTKDIRKQRTLKNVEG